MNKPIFESAKDTLMATKKFIGILLIIFVFFYFVSGVYSISQNEIAVHERFGKVINGRVMPGIHYAFPWPIDTVHKLPVKTVKRIEITDFGEENRYDNPYYNLTGLSIYGITGDNNIVNISCGIQYSISDPRNYLYSIHDAERILHESVASSLIHRLATMSVDEVLTFGKREIENYVKREAQQEMDRLEAGLAISFVELNSVNPPQKVQEYFDDVINATIDRRKMISQAETYRNEKIPQAKAFAFRVISQAQAYEKDVIAKAEGETQRFLKRLSEYQKEKDVIRRQRHLECLRNVFRNIGKFYVLSNKQGNVPANLKLFRRGSWAFETDVPEAKAD